MEICVRILIKKSKKCIIRSIIKSHKLSLTVTLIIVSFLDFSKRPEPAIPQIICIRRKKPEAMENTCASVVKPTISVCSGSFWLLQLREAERWHVPKSKLFWLSVVSARFYAMHGSNALIVVDIISDKWFRLVFAVHSIPHPSGPTLCLEPWLIFFDDWRRWVDDDGTDAPIGSATACRPSLKYGPNQFEYIIVIIIILPS